MSDFAKGCKVGVVRIVILDEDPFILQADNGYAIVIVLDEGGDPKAICRSRPQVLARRWCLAPI